jgi:hypothetical protein
MLLWKKSHRSLNRQHAEHHLSLNFYLDLIIRPAPPQRIQIQQTDTDIFAGLRTERWEWTACQRWWLEQPRGAQAQRKSLDGSHLGRLWRPIHETLPDPRTPNAAGHASGVLQPNCQTADYHWATHSSTTTKNFVDTNSNCFFFISRNRLRPDTELSIPTRTCVWTTAARWATAATLLTWTNGRHGWVRCLIFSDYLAL